MIAGLFFGLSPNRAFGIIVFQQTGARFDQHTVLASIHKGRESELSGQQNGLLLMVKKKNGCAIPPIVGLSCNGLPGPVFSPDIERGPFKNRPIVRENFYLFYSDFVFHGSVCGVSRFVPVLVLESGHVA
jgi:hypothetical protein